MESKDIKYRQQRDLKNAPAQLSISERGYALRTKLSVGAFAVSAFCAAPRELEKNRGIDLHEMADPLIEHGPHLSVSIYIGLINAVNSRLEGRTFHTGDGVLAAGLANFVYEVQTQSNFKIDSVYDIIYGATGGLLGALSVRAKNDQAAH